jgi:dephospho-CoA kinase
VYAPIDVRYQRVRQRDGMSKQEFFSRVDRQIPLEEKRKWADFVIDNSKDLETLERNAREVFDKLMRLQRKKETHPVASIN